MTNEEKAREISEKRIICEQNNITGELAIRYAYDACMDMAQWKDEKFAAEKQALICNACEWLAKNYQNLDYINMKGDLFDLSMVEDFRKAMEGME